MFGSTKLSAQLVRKRNLSSLLKPVTGVLSLCMLCCAIPYILLFTGLISVATAAYLKSQAVIVMAVIVVIAVLLLVSGWFFGNSRQQVKHA